jgi:ribonuclease-3
MTPLEQTLGYEFRSPALLEEALTHRSAASLHNERLEFLGDSVVNTLAVEYLFLKYPELSEGDLAKRKSAMVSGDALAGTARAWRLGDSLRLGKSEQELGKDKSSILEGATEALMGAIYLDSGCDLEVARRILQRFHFSREAEILGSEVFRNSKGSLLELTQKLGMGMPQYQLVEVGGPEHSRVFHATVTVQGRLMGAGEGTSKKDAEVAAAQKAMRAMQGLQAE